MRELGTIRQTGVLNRNRAHVQPRVGTFGVKPEKRPSYAGLPRQNANLPSRAANPPDLCRGQNPQNLQKGCWGRKTPMSPAPEKGVMSQKTSFSRGHNREEEDSLT